MPHTLRMGNHKRGWQAGTVHLRGIVTVLPCLTVLPLPLECQSSCTAGMYLRPGAPGATR